MMTGSPAAMPSSANGTIRAANSASELYAAGLVVVANLAARRASPHHKTPVCPASGRAAPLAAALVAMNICVTSIASARPLLVGGVLQLLTGLCRAGLLLFRRRSLGVRFPAASQLPVWALPLAAWAVFAALSRPLTGITSFPRGPVTPGTRRTPVGFPGPQQQPAHTLGQRERPRPGVPGPARSWSAGTPRPGPPRGPAAGPGSAASPEAASTARNGPIRSPSWAGWRNELSGFTVYRVRRPGPGAGGVARLPGRPRWPARCAG